MTGRVVKVSEEGDIAVSKHCMPIEHVDQLNRRYGLRKAVTGYFHFDNEIVVRRVTSGESRLELTRGDQPIRLEVLDSYVREFIAELFRDHSIAELALDKAAFGLRLYEPSAWARTERQAMQLADKLYLERMAFVSARRPQPRLTLPATA